MQTKLHVELLGHTPEPERSIYAAGRLCYSPENIDDLHRSAGQSPERVQAFIRKIRRLGHLSVFEHVQFTFGIQGISRACSHQLVRHRIASFSQQSQRYVSENQFEYVLPPRLRDAMGQQWFDERMQQMQQWYCEAREAGVPAEDARFLLPNACETRLVLSMNARSLLHFFALRCCERAQWEIRALAERMLSCCRPVAPELFSEAGPGCVAGPCPEGDMTCGKAAQVRLRYGVF